MNRTRTSAACAPEITFMSKRSQESWGSFWARPVAGLGVLAGIYYAVTHPLVQDAKPCAESVSDKAASAASRVSESSDAAQGVSSCFSSALQNVLVPQVLHYVIPAACGAVAGAMLVLVLVMGLRLLRSLFAR